MSTEKTQQAKAWLEDVLQRCGLQTQVSAEPPAILSQLKDFGGCWLTIEPESLSPNQVEILTTRNAAVLDALQYLLTSTLNLDNSVDVREAYTVELGSLRADRYRELADLAVEAATQVRETQAEYQMPPLTAAERRLVHTVLYDEVDVQTQSRGEEPDRRLVILPVIEAGAVD